MKKPRRPRNPIQLIADDAIDYCEHQGLDISVASVTDNMTKRIRLSEAVACMHMLLTPQARRRLDARNYAVSEMDEFERKEFARLTNEEFREGKLRASDEHLERVRKWHKANAAVAKLLDAKAASLGRPVTVEELMPEVEKIYGRYGLTV